MKPYSRADRVGGLIQEILSDILHKEVSDPRLEMTTISGVEMSRDLRIAKIYFSVPKGKKSCKDAAAGFKSAKGYLKKILAKKLGLRYMPDLKFFYDESFDYGSHINSVLKSINNNNGTNRS